MKIKPVNTIFLIMFCIFIILFSWWIIRAVNEIGLDDVHPNIPCSENLFLESDSLWIIPVYKNDSIANYPVWCQYIKSFNKTLGMHGVYHTYREFGEIRNSSYLDVGVNAFQECFGYKLAIFEAPQIYFNKGNEVLLQKNNLNYYGFYYHLMTKIFHCNDQGTKPNWWIRIF